MLKYIIVYKDGSTQTINVRQLSRLGKNINKTFYDIDFICCESEYSKFVRNIDDGR